MNIATKPAYSSLAQRIARVRNCMLVEVSSGISATDKDLFVSLCQAYEQHNIETACTASTSSQNGLDQAFSLSHLVPESFLPHDLTAIAISGKDALPRQHRSGFSLINWPHLADFDDWGDWDDAL